VPDLDRIIVVGAGPVGAVMALALCRLGLSVALLEADAEPFEDQRAATVHPPTVAMLENLGLRADAWDSGLLSPLFHYRDRASGELVAEFDVGRLEGDVAFPFVLQWEQYKLVRAALKQLLAAELAQVRFSTKVVGLRQTEDAAFVTLETGEELAGSFVIGTDGGRSTIRKLAGIAFEGFTWPERFIKIGTYFNFLETGRGYCTRNYFSDPDEWLNLFKVKGEGEPGIWRGIFPTRLDESDEEALSPVGVQQRLQKFLPEAGGYEIAYHALYKVHQRVAARFNLGRILLAGDAAHVNNPIGGMGMNGGIHDAVNLAEKLHAIAERRADFSVLDRYTRQRRTAQIDFVQAQSVQNKNALSEKDPFKRREHLDMLRRTAEDAGLHKKFLRRSSLIDSLEAANAVD
jgi:3-(3-hydroxy-phenyl)propionate hydroxylase